MRSISLVPHDVLHFEPLEPIGETFEFEQDGRRLTGRATVSEPEPFVFVFTIYEHGGNLPTHTMVTAMKPGSSADALRAKCRPSTERDAEACRDWKRVAERMTVTTMR